MATWYKIDRWRDEIKPIEVIRETEHFIVIPNEWGRRKEQRVRKCDDYHSTYADARAALIARCRTSVNYYQEALDKAQARLSKAENLPQTLDH